MNPTKQGLKHAKPAGADIGLAVLAHESNKTRIETINME